MNTKPIVLFGLGQIAELALYYFESESDRHVEAFTVDADWIDEETFLDRPVEPFENIEQFRRSEDYDMFVAIGYSQINALRQQKCTLARAKGYDLASFISPHAYVADNVEFGANCFILENNTVQPFTRIGDGATLWSGNHVGHHARIGDFAFISSHVVLSGNVTIGTRTFIGVNATISDRVSIGARCVVGSGSLVTKDLPDGSVTVANPTPVSPVPSDRLRRL